MTLYTTDPGAKARFIRALRDLADYLDQNTTVPVPASGATIMLHASSADYGGREQVNRIATLLGADVHDDTARGGHYRAVRNFGPIGYEIVAITEAYTATHDALMSYRGCVSLDLPPDGTS